MLLIRPYSPEIWNQLYSLQNEEPELWSNIESEMNLSGKLHLALKRHFKDISSNATASMLAAESVYVRGGNDQHGKQMRLGEKKSLLSANLIFWKRGIIWLISEAIIMPGIWTWMKGWSSLETLRREWGRTFFRTPS